MHLVFALLFAMVTGNVVDAPEAVLGGGFKAR
jgi:hypothetical protein